MDAGLDTAGIVHFAFNHYDHLRATNLVSNIDEAPNVNVLDDVGAPLFQPTAAEDTTEDQHRAEYVEHMWQDDSRT